MPPAEPTRTLPAWVRLADALAAIAWSLAAWVWLFGATSRMYVLGIRVSIRSPERAFLAGAAIVLLRHWFERRHPLVQRWIGAVRRIRDAGERRLFGPFSTRPGLEWLAVTLGFAALVVVATWPQCRDLYGVPDLGDPLFNVWRLSWVAHQLPIDPRHIFDANIFYPEHLTLTYSDAVLVPALFSAPFLWLGAPQMPTYTLLFLSGWVFSGVATYYLVRALTGRRDAAAIAGVIFAIYPYRAEHYSHLELQMTMWMPLTLWALHRTLASGRWRDGLLTGGAYAMQMLSSLYYGLFLAVYMVPLAASLWLFRGRPRRPLRALAAGAIVAGVIIAPVAAAYVANKPMFGERDVATIESYSATPADYTHPHFRSALYGAWAEGGLPERQLFPGLVAVALAIVGLWPPLNAARLGYALAGALAFNGSLGLHGLSYPWLRAFFSPFRGLRVPARFSILFGLTLAVLAGYGVARILERWPSRRRWLTVACFMLVFADLRPHVELVHAWSKPPGIYAVIPATPPAVLAEFPIGEDGHGLLLDNPYDYFSTFHWHRLINGASGFFPPSWQRFQDACANFPDDACLHYLQSRGVQYIGVHGGFYRDPEGWKGIEAQLSTSPLLKRLAAARFAGGTSILYQLAPTAAPR